MQALGEPRARRRGRRHARTSSASSSAASARPHELRLWEMEAIDQYGGPQALIGELARLQRVDGPERVARLLGAPGRLPRLDRGPRRQHRGGPARPDGRAAAPGRGALHQPDAPACSRRRPTQSPHPPRPPGSSATTQRDALARGRRAPRATGPRDLAGAARALRRPRARKATASATCPTARRSTATTSWPGRRSTRTRGPSTTTASSDSPRSRPRRGRSPRELGHDDIARAAPLARRAARTTMSRQPLRLVERGRGAHRARRGRRAALVRATARGGLPGPGRRAAHGAGGAAGLLRAAHRGRQPQGRLLHQHVRPGLASPPPAAGHDLPRGRAGPPLPDRHRAGAHRPADLPSLRVAPGRRRLRGGLGPLRRAPGRARWASTTRRGSASGPLESEAWRAVRLVVDTGIHALGWTRQQSIDLLRERAGLSQLEAETETDRYISWPGQALSYMIGQREILTCGPSSSGATGAWLRPHGPSMTRPSATGRCRSRRCGRRLPGWRGARQGLEGWPVQAADELVERVAQPIDLVGRVVVHEPDAHHAALLGEPERADELPGVVVAVPGEDARARRGSARPRAGGGPRG